MKIIVNNTTFTNAGWSVFDGIGTLDLYTDLSLVDILTLLGNNPNISLCDDDDILLSMWVTKGVKSIKEDVIMDQRRVVVNLDASILSSNVEGALTTNVNNSIDGILELATAIDAIESDLNDKEDAMDQLRADLTSTNDDILTINTRLEAIPNDLMARLDSLWTSYNALSDRVATIENGLS